MATENDRLPGPPDEDGFRKVAETDDLDPGEGMGVEIDGMEIALFNVDGEYFAMSNRCAHQQAPLCKVGEKKINGELCWTEHRGGVDEDVPGIQCPWHLWEWDLDTGRHDVSGKRMAAFDVKVDDEDLLVRV